MTPSTARGAALCLLLLCTIQAPAGAQLTPRPLPPDLAFSGAAGAAAADTASADALGAVGERAGDHAGTGRPDASEAARLLGETAFGAVGSLVGGSIGAFAAAATFDVACDDGRWSCATGTFLVFAGLGIGSTLGSGLMARLGNHAFGGRSSLRGSLIGGLAGMAVGGAIAGWMLSDPGVDDGPAVVVYTVAQGALAPAGGRLFQRDR